MRNLSWIGLFVCTSAISAYLGDRIASEDRSVYLPGETSHGHYQIELQCDSCHTERNEVKSEACLRCHEQELAIDDDSHAPSKFLDPRNAALVEKLDARACITCHTEHRPMLTDSMGVTLPADYCYYCHEDVGDERPTHARLDHDSCQTAGCHNFHDNRGLHEDFLELHLDEPALLHTPAVPRMARAFAGPGLTAAQADAPKATQKPAIVDAWASSAHAHGEVNCSGCHKGRDAGFETRVDEQICAECHEVQVEGFRQSRHGMRLAAGLPPMRPELARLPMKAQARGRELGCSSCHGAHAYDVARAASEACVGCHDDPHTRAYAGSLHAQSAAAERAGRAVRGSGVTCATCHLPTVPVRAGAFEHFVQHNQNDNLRPNEKMLRSVCAHCHGVGFSLDALADPALIENNFRGRPSGETHVESLDWIAKRRAARGEPKN